MFDKISFDRLTTYTLPEGSISEAGIAAIHRLVTSADASGWPGSQHRYLPGLPDEWEWRWLVQSGTYRGNFPKRAAQYWYSQHQIKCPPEFLSQLGNVARAHASQPIVYRFDFTRTVEWESGDFGDRGSCYWGSRSGALQMIRENGGAVRFFDLSGDGIGRAWLAPYKTNVIVFNGYGLPGDPTFRIAQILAAYWSADYLRVPLINQGSANGSLWINGGRGYLIGHDLPLEPFFFDLEWEEIGSGCEHCERSLTDDEAHYTPEDERLCASCFYAICDYCARCGDAHYNDGMYYVEGEDRFVCEYCFERYYTICTGCTESYRDDQIRHDPKTDDPYCEPCLADLKAERRTQR